MDERKNKDREDKNLENEEATEECAICQMHFAGDHLLARLTCNPLHTFHLSCLKRWSDISTTCPYCRIEFGEYQLLAAGGKDVVGTRPVKRRSQTASTANPITGGMEDAEEEFGSCQICSQESDDHLLLLCDSCDDAYHTYCLRPRLDSVPPPDIPWLCPVCTELPSRPSMSVATVTSSTLTANQSVRLQLSSRTNRRLIRNSDLDLPPPPSQTSRLETSTTATELGNLARIRRARRRRRMVRRPNTYPINDHDQGSSSSAYQPDIYRIVAKHLRLGRSENVREIYKSIERHTSMPTGSNQSRNNFAFSGTSITSEAGAVVESAEEDDLWKAFEQARDLEQRDTPSSTSSSSRSRGVSNSSQTKRVAKRKK